MAQGAALPPRPSAAQRRASGLPSIREITAAQESESARARMWRLSLGLTTGQLSALTGYSARAIRYMEAGIGSRGHKIGAGTWKRYKLACLAVHRWNGKPGLPQAFEWNWAQ